MTARYGKKSHPDTWRELPIDEVLSHCSGLTCSQLAKTIKASHSVMRRVLNSLELRGRVRTEGLVQKRYYRVAG